VTPTPLLEEEGDALRLASVAERPDPLSIDCSMAVTRLAPSYHPVDAIKLQVVQRPEQWLRADKPDGGRHIPQPVCPFHPSLVLDGHAHPNIGWPGELRGQRFKAVSAFRKNLELVLLRFSHRLEHGGNEIVPHLWMKQIAH
jgi:hypothetical protein